MKIFILVLILFIVVQWLIGSNSFIEYKKSINGKDVLKYAKSGDLILFSGDPIVKFWGGSNFSHVGVVVDLGSSGKFLYHCTNRDDLYMDHLTNRYKNGTQLNNLEEFIYKDKSRLYYFENLSPIDENELIENIHKIGDVKFNGSSLDLLKCSKRFRFIPKMIGGGKGEGMFCSQAICKAFSICNGREDTVHPSEFTAIFRGKIYNIKCQREKY